MKRVEIDEYNNGFTVIYTSSGAYGVTNETYVYKSTEDLQMLTEIVKRYLGRKVKIEEA